MTDVIAIVLYLVIGIVVAAALLYLDVWAIEDRWFLGVVVVLWPVIALAAFGWGALVGLGTVVRMLGGRKEGVGSQSEEGR